MAETKNTTRGRKPKVEETKEVKETKETTTNENAIIAQLMEQIAQLQSQINNQSKQQSSAKEDFGLKKIKCVNLMHNPINVSTEPNGGGKVYTFEKYGDYRMIRFDDLSDILSSYPYTMEHGLIYITDSKVVEAFGLTDEYSKLYDKATMDKIVYLREETDVDLFIGMEKNLRESTAREIAKLMNQNERMDYNYLRRIKDECNLDIEQIAKDILEEEKRAESESE